MNNDLLNNNSKGTLFQRDAGKKVSPKKGQIKLQFFVSKKCNDVLGYRVGEAMRAHLKGLALHPDIYNPERYQETIPYRSIFVRD